MPDIDGLQLARSIRADSRLTSTRLLLLTSANQKGGAQEAAAAGIDGYLTKPVRSGLLRSLLLTVLGFSEMPSVQLVTPEHPAIGRVDARLLLAEDNEINQLVAAHALRAIGYQVDVVGNGEQALQALDEHTYEAVLMDCQMPVIDGYTATQELRHREGSGRRTPVIALTASAMTADRKRCYAAGMDAHLSKPFAAEELGAILRRWVSNAPVRTGSSGPPPRMESVFDEGRMIDSSRLDMLQQLSVDGPSILREIIGAYDVHLPAALEALERTVQQGDAAGARRHAHQLRGAAANIGASSIAALAASIGSAARANRLVELPELLARLQVEAPRVSAALHSYTDN
jgi:CheY-like chemotaxis protein